MFRHRNRLQKLMDKDKIIRGVRLILEGIGEDPEREGLIRTPERIYEFYEQIFNGINATPEKALKLYTTTNKDELIIVRDIQFYSMCEHHLLPFFGKVHIAYIPQKNKITGFSNLVDIVELFASRPNIQERMTTDIAENIYRILSAKGVLVIVEAEQLCMTMTGVRKPGARAITSAVRGLLREEATRAEAMALIKQ